MNKFNVYFTDMKSQSSKRTYRMTARAKKASENEINIMKAAVELWVDFSIQDITLEKVAEKSGVTVRTILRKFGSKEGLIEACVENDTASRRNSRDLAVTGEYKNALDILLQDYEKLGDASFRTLAVEKELPIARKILNRGRKSHREWCARIFSTDLPEVNAPDYEHKLLTFITATEFYLWKLLRRDLGKSYEETFEVFKSLVEGLIQRKIT
ncbi:TetR/AcrR family transcriptional regulator [Shivajiella indica]|uniref:TetR/AcrR family transcriptional regulator n=1 Tax=Shivajiella indica TaxID=872115 RepID=A0ABW5BB52_9BACT